MTIRRKNFSSILAMLSLYLMLISCGNEATKLTIGYIPIAECIPLYVAQEKGFFEHEGLEVEMLPLAGGAVIMNYLDSKSVDIGFSNVVSLVLKRANKFDFISIYGATYETENNQNHALISSSSMGAGELREAIIGKTIAINTKNNIEEMMVKKYLFSNNVPLDSVKFIEVPFPRMLPYLDNSSIDVASIVEPFISVAMKSTTHDYSYIGNQYLAAKNRVLVATYVTSEKVLKEKKTAVTKFINAMRKSTEYINNNEADIRQIIGSYTKIPANLLPVIGLSEFGDKIDRISYDQLVKDMVEYEYISEFNIPQYEQIVYGE